jgi:class 3 adenylate cyclase
VPQSRMAKLQHKSVGHPDEVRPFRLGQLEIFDLDDFVMGRMIMEPGWTWQKDVRPIAGTERCMYHHLGYVVSGTLHVSYSDGTEATIGPEEMYEIPPGHDAEVVGDESWVAIDFRGARSYARPVAASADRILATILFTDIVDSTGSLQRVGDAVWSDQLARYNELVQFELDRYRGREIKETGDGSIALFDGPARAVECAASIARSVRTVGIEVRCGVHTGEVELVPDDVRGVAVHLAQRIMGLAGPGEVLISAVTRDLLAGSGLRFESRGRHELKGIEGEREVFALVS